MFYHERLNDDYEIHRRHTRHLTEEDLGLLGEGPHVSGPSWYARLRALLGDGLISLGRNIKGRRPQRASTHLSQVVSERS